MARRRPVERCEPHAWEWSEHHRHHVCGKCGATRYEVNPLQPQATRYAGLGYARITRDCWQHVDCTPGERVAQVGPQYRTRAELLADTARYARDAWGLE